MREALRFFGDEAMGDGVASAWNKGARLAELVGRQRALLVLDKPTVEAIALCLQDEAGLRPFLDAWHLVPGDPWMTALERAIERSAAVAVFSSAPRGWVMGP